MITEGGDSIAEGAIMYMGMMGSGVGDDLGDLDLDLDDLDDHCRARE
jgi:hypothetical protein